MKTKKKCFKCEKVKPLSEFYKHKEMADGHLNKCKVCTKNDVRKHREENDSVREYDRARASLPHRIALNVATTKKYREKYPERYKAHTAVNNAVRDGRLARPDHCEGCGHPCIPHAHHWSYDEEHRLDVEWLCPLCHERMHHKKETF